MAVVSGPVDFFISYASADRPWAEWIAWELDAAGYSTRIQAWDVQPGSDFVHEMHEATLVAQRTVAVLSPAFLASEFCEAEWREAFRKDPSGRERRLVPVRVRECDPDGLLGSRVYVDVVGLSEQGSRDALLAGVSQGRAKPSGAPEFPGRKASVVAERQRVRRPEGGAAIFNVPAMTRTFVGRERALEQLGQGLAGEGAVAVTQVDAIHGLGGVGKTQLAARYARLHRGDYDVIWWLRAEQPATLRADLSALAVALGLVSIEVDEQDAVAAAGGWLARNGRWLLVFDNVPAPAAIAELVPEGEGGHVVITSRAHADWRALSAQSVPLDVWERQESRAFLGARTGEQDIGVLDEVSEVLGDLPLALEQAAAYTNTTAVTLVGYLQRLRDRAPDLFAASRPLGYGHTITTAWQFAFDQIAEHPVASELVAVCAHLAPERIPRELLEELHDAADGPAFAAYDVDDAITLLLGYGLLTPATEQTFGMHRLIGQLVRSAADPVVQTRAAAWAVRRLDALWPVRPSLPDQWPVCRRLLAHALTSTDHAVRLDAAPIATARVLVRVGQYQQARSELGSACELMRRALRLEEAVYGSEHPEVAVTLGCLGIVLQAQGEFAAARNALERAFAINQAVYGPEHPDVAGSLSNLGNLLHQLGELEPARDAQQRAVRITEAVYGPAHPELALALGNFGIVLSELGELEGAREAEQRALAITEAVYGPDHAAVAAALGNLGNTLGSLGELEPARATLQRALAINEVVYGPEHPTVAMNLTNLGVVLKSLDELGPAREVLQRALTSATAVFGPEHPAVANVLGNLGDVLIAVDELGEARASLQRALIINEAVYGSQHGAVAATLTRLGNVLVRAGELGAARQAQERAVAINEVVYGLEHPQVAKTLANLGIVLWELGALPAAQEKVQRALAIFEHALPPEHPDVAQARLLLAMMRGRWDSSPDPGRNEPCPCGSGKKFKKCHGR